jgi:NAD-dependent SIR2 family protein deacetylase
MSDYGDQPHPNRISVAPQALSRSTARFVSSVVPFNGEIKEIEEIECGKCHVLMYLNDGAEWPSSGELAICNQCAQELAAIIFAAFGT